MRPPFLLLFLVSFGFLVSPFTVGCSRSSVLKRFPAILKFIGVRWDNKQRRVVSALKANWWVNDRLHFLTTFSSTSSVYVIMSSFPSVYIFFSVLPPYIFQCTVFLSSLIPFLLSPSPSPSPSPSLSLSLSPPPPPLVKGEALYTEVKTPT